MIKNRTTQIIYQVIYCTLGLIGCIASLGIFDEITKFRWDFYVHFTNLSNFLCLGIMFAALIQTIKKKENSYVKTAPMLKFIGMLAILLTFFVFNFVLAGQEGRWPQLNWRIGSLLFHVVLPIMYIADWFLFYERRKAKWYYPLASTSFPLGYVFFLLIQALILGFNSSITIPQATLPAGFKAGAPTPLIYPYFFVNLETQGAKVIIWIVALAFAFILMGFIFFALDKISRKKKRNK